MRSFRTYAPSYEQIVDWLRSNFDGSPPAKAGLLRELEVVVPLSPEQARRGGVVRLLVPVQLACPLCRGRGGVGPYECWRCSGAGAIAEEVPVHLAFPAGLIGDHFVQVALDQLGIRNLYLRVHFQVEPSAP